MRARPRIEPMFHEPVLVAEVLDLLRPGGGNADTGGPGPTVIDATCGGGGHAQAILENLAAGCRERRVGAEPARLLALDLDPEALASAERRLGGCRSEGVRLFLRQASYIDMAAVVDELSLSPVTGVLFDFGVSLYQVRTPGRGFSYDLDGPLDMRFDPTEDRPTAAEILRRATVDELRGWLCDYGELPRAGRLAWLIHRHRDEISSTGELAAVVRRGVPFRQVRRLLSRVFQALRIVVNDELSAVEQGLEAAFSVLVPGGRLVTICYHSLEDRICKRFMRGRAATGEMWLPVRRAVRPSADEVERNRAARSARLRVAEKGTKPVSERAGRRAAVKRVFAGDVAKGVGE